MDRAYITIGGGERDPATAIWIQTGSQYFDLRIPHDRPSFRGKRSPGDFTADELRWLARQSGDTGVCTIEASVATWQSASDRFGFFSDETSFFPDDGRLERRSGILIETETASSPVPYEEAWVQQPFDHGLTIHLTLRESDEAQRVLGVLLIAGRYAGWVESRTAAAHVSLETQLEGCRGDTAQMRRILACEASYAIRERADAPFVVRHSALPFREGEVLEVPRFDRRRLDRRSRLPASRTGTEWCVEAWHVAKPGRPT